MDKLVKGQIFTMEDLIPLRRAQTISKGLVDKEGYKISLFSLAEGTDISEEFYPYPSLFLSFKGRPKIAGQVLAPGQLLLAEEDSFRGVRAGEDSIYLEITLERGDQTMENIDKGQVIQLKDYIDYVEDGVANLDLVSRDDLKIMLMAFDKGQGLSPHSAPGDALVIALEGKGQLQVDEDYFDIEPGQQMVFPKDIIHNVRAEDDKFKMALILVIDD